MEIITVHINSDIRKTWFLNMLTAKNKVFVLIRLFLVK